MSEKKDISKCLTSAFLKHPETSFLLKFEKKNYHLEVIQIAIYSEVLKSALVLVDSMKENQLL